METLVIIGFLTALTGLIASLITLYRLLSEKKYKNIY